jgi:hypothetical protein
VGDLELVAAGDELTAIPEAACGFHGHDIDGTGNDSHDPAYDIVHSVKAHIRLILNVAKDAIFGHKHKFLELVGRWITRIDGLGGRATRKRP